MAPDDAPQAESRVSSDPGVPNSVGREITPEHRATINGIAAQSAAASDSSGAHSGAARIEFPFDDFQPVNRISNVLEALLSHCKEFEPSPRWQHCCTQADLATTNTSITPDCAATLAASLLESCHPDDLIAANIFVWIEGALQLNPKLSAPSAPLIALQDKSTGLVYDVLTPTGLLSGDGLPAVAVLKDWITVRAIEATSGPVFLAFDLETVILLRAVGLPATLAIGFDNITADNLKQLSEHFGLKRRPSWRTLDWPDRNYHEPPDSIASSAALDPSSEEPTCPELALVAWDVAGVSRDEPVGFRAAVAAFRDLETYLNLDIVDLHVWQLQHHDLDKLQFVIDRGEPDWTRELILDLACERPNLLFLLDQASKAKTQIDTFVKAVAQLHSMLREAPQDFRGRERWHAAVRDYCRTMLDELIAPLLSDVDQTVDPIRRNTKAAFAQVSSLVHLKMPFVYEELFAGMRNSARPNELGKHIKELLALTNQMLSMARAL